MNRAVIPPKDASCIAEPDAASRSALAARLRALAHPARIAMLETLAAHDRCVCGEIVRALPLAQSTVSQHLKVLMDAGLIRSRTEGQRSSYCIDREALAALEQEVEALFAALKGPSRCAAAPAVPEER